MTHETAESTERTERIAGVAARGLTLACRMGDLEISWDPEDDEKILAVIEKKMAEGVRFFILKPMFGELLHVRRQITDVAEIRTNRVKIKDADIEALFRGGAARLFRTNHEIGDARPAQSAREVVANRSIGVPILAGG